MNTLGYDDSVTHNGEPIDFEYFAGDFTVFL